MRVPYTAPTVDQFNLFFEPVGHGIKGGGLGDIKVYKPENYGRGGSFLGVLTGVIKKALPFLRGLILPEARNFTKNVMADLGNNVPVKKSFKKNLIQSAKNLGKRVVGGKKLKRLKKKRKHSCKSKNKDVFNNNLFG